MLFRNPKKEEEPQDQNEAKMPAVHENNDDVQLGSNVDPSLAEPQTTQD